MFKPLTVFHINILERLPQPSSCKATSTAGMLWDGTRVDYLDRSFELSMLKPNFEKWW